MGTHVPDVPEAGPKPRGNGTRIRMLTSFLAAVVVGGFRLRSARKTLRRQTGWLCRARQGVCPSSRESRLLRRMSAASAACGPQRAKPLHRGTAPTANAAMAGLSASLSLSLCASACVCRCGSLPCAHVCAPRRSRRARRAPPARGRQISVKCATWAFRPTIWWPCGRRRRDDRIAPRGIRCGRRGPCVASELALPNAHRSLPRPLSTQRLVRDLCAWAAARRA